MSKSERIFQLCLAHLAHFRPEFYSHAIAIMEKMSGSREKTWSYRIEKALIFWGGTFGMPPMLASDLLSREVLFLDFSPRMKRLSPKNIWSEIRFHRWTSLADEFFGLHRREIPCNPINSEAESMMKFYKHHRNFNERTDQYLGLPLQNGSGALDSGLEWPCFFFRERFFFSGASLQNARNHPEQIGKTPPQRPLESNIFRAIRLESRIRQGKAAQKSLKLAQIKSPFCNLLGQKYIRALCSNAGGTSGVRSIS